MYYDPRISKNTLVLQGLIRAYKGPLPNHFDPCNSLQYWGTFVNALTHIDLLL